MTWQPELDELRARERMAREMGGPDKVKRQHDGGRLTVRERIDRLIDKGSFHEVGAIAGKAEYDADGKLTKLTPSNCVMGRATIDGRPVVVLGDDFTVRGGSADATIPRSRSWPSAWRNELRLPIIRIIEGSGGGGSVKTIETTGRANLPGGSAYSSIGYQYLADNLGTVPVVALGLGSVAGLGAARLAASHYSMMTKETSAMFVAGPPVVARIGQHLEQAGARRLGDPVHERAPSITRSRPRRRRSQCARRFLSYLPSSVYSVPARGRARRSRRPARRDAVRGDPARPAQGLQDAARSSRRWSTRAPSSRWGRCSAARSSPAWRGSTGCRSRSWRSDPYHYGGAWTADACDKIVRFVDLAETFHLPVVYLCDCPGFLIGLEAEKRRDHPLRRARHGGDQPVERALVHRHRAQLVRRRRRGARAGRAARDPLCLAVGAGGARCRSRAASRPPIAPRSTPRPIRKAKLAEIEARLNALRSPFRTAETFWVEEIIDPRDTRKLLCEFANLAEPLRTPGPRAFAMRP